MSRTSDVLLGGAITFVTFDGLLASTCGRACGFTVEVGAASDLTGLLGLAGHDCPLRGQVMAEVLAEFAPEPVGGGRRG